MAQAIIYGTQSVKIKKKTYLYKDGDECNLITGGWKIGTLDDGSVTKNKDNMYFKVNSGVTNDWKSAKAYTTNQIDFSKYTRVCIEYKTNYNKNILSSYQCYVHQLSCIGFQTNVNGYSLSTAEGYEHIVNFTPTTQPNLMQVPIELQGNTHLVLVCASEHGAKDLTIFKIWLESEE